MKAVKFCSVVLWKKKEIKNEPRVWGLLALKARAGQTKWFWGLYTACKPDIPHPCFREKEGKIVKKKTK